MNQDIYDAHAYIGADYHTYFHQLRDYSIERYRSVMEACGIRKALLVPGGMEAEVDDNFARICEAADREPDRFFGLHRVLPRQPDALEKMERSLRRNGIKGIMLHPHWDTYLANARMLDPFFDLLSDFGKPALVYCGDIPYTMPAQIADMAVRFPKVPVIIGHMAKTEVYQHVTASALRSDNLFLETSGCNITNIIEEAVARLGASRVMFGSGWPGMSPQAEIYKISKLKISDADKEQLFSGTFRSLFLRPEAKEATDS